jgi:hypothetical protein
MNFFSKGIAKVTSGVGGRAFARVAVVAAFACPMIGCSAEVGSSEEVAEDLGSAAEALSPPVTIINSASLLGCPGDRVALKSIDGGYYVTAEQTGGGAMACDRGALGPWELFRVKEITYTSGPKRIALRSNDGSGPYVSATNGGGSSIYANRNAIGDWESFGVVAVSGMKALQSVNGPYVTREDNGGPGCVLNANRPGIGPWETFQVECH